MSTDNKDRIMHLLADRATQGLSREELIELNELLEKHPQWDNPYFDLTAAAVSLTDLEIDEPLPDELRQKIMANAFQYVNSEQAANARQTAGPDEQANGDPAKQNPGTVVTFPQRAGAWQRMGWYAAAACLILALAGWWPRLTQSPEPVNLSALREQLLAESTDVIKSDWKPANDQGSGRLSGDVVWSNARQEGYMRFSGMPVIDPQVNAYQLWIFDARQDERYPVDGGIFAVDQKTGEAIVQIHAKLKISQPTLFAITIEKPGGVVVSQRDSLVAVARVE
jgi:hypothetical protein